MLVAGTALATLWFHHNTFVPLFLAVLVVVLISIPVGQLQRLRVPRGVAIAVTVIAAVEAASGPGFFLLPGLSDNLSELARRLPLLSEQITEAYDTVSGRTDVLGGLLPPLCFELGGSSLPARLEQTLYNTLIMELPVPVRGGSFALILLANAFLVAILAVFLVAEPKLVRRCFTQEGATLVRVFHPNV